MHAQVYRRFLLTLFLYRIEWESVPQSVAFYHPYVFAFDLNFIEIRHVETVSKGGTHTERRGYVTNINLG